MKIMIMMKYDSLIMFTAGIKRCDQTCGERGNCGRVKSWLLTGL